MQSCSRSFLNLSTDRHISRFLRVSLNIGAIARGEAIHRRLQKLSTMTDGLGLGNAYSLDKVGSDEGRKRGFAWPMRTSHAKQPMRAGELRHALTMEIRLPNLNSDNAPLIEAFLARSQRLVVVDKEASTTLF